MPSKTPTGPSPAAQKARILERAEREKVKFMRLQFTDILGTIKNVEIPDRQFEEALDGKIMFDGSSIEGFVRIEESDMYLRPDLSTPSASSRGPSPTGEKVARMICDIYTPDGQPFVGCPRTDAEEGDRAGRGAAAITMKAGPEAEFFLFQTQERRADHRDARRGQLLRSEPGRSWAKTSAARSSSRSRRWASTSRPRITRSRRASTRSTSATTMC